MQCISLAGRTQRLKNFPKELRTFTFHFSRELRIPQLKIHNTERTKLFSNYPKIIHAYYFGIFNQGFRIFFPLSPLKNHQKS